MRQCASLSNQRYARTPSILPLDLLAAISQFFPRLSLRLTLFRAIKASGLSKHPFVKEMGLDFNVGPRGSKLPADTRQLVALARCMYRTQPLGVRHPIRPIASPPQAPSLQHAQRLSLPGANGMLGVDVNSQGARVRAQRLRHSAKSRRSVTLRNAYRTSRVFETRRRTAA